MKKRLKKIIKKTKELQRNILKDIEKSLKHHIENTIYDFNKPDDIPEKIFLNVYKCEIDI